MQRYIQSLGCGRFCAVTMEALCRVPTAPIPATVHADEVWARDLPKSLGGMTFVITGSSRGMGFALAKRIAERGGNLIHLNRSSSHAQQAHEQLATVARAAGGSSLLIDCDLCKFSSVRAAAETLRREMVANKWLLDCLVLNAGLMAQQDVRTADGYDIQMQANHLSHFLLTSLLFDLLDGAAAIRGEARVVSHSSGARDTPAAALREDSFEQSWAVERGSKNPCAGDSWPGMGKWQRYQQSKRANLAFSYALANFIKSKDRCGVKAVCAHPGATNSGLQSRTGGSSWLDNFINGLAAVSGHSTDDGCLGLALATVKHGVSNGDFFGPVSLTGNAILLPDEREHNYNEDQLRMLWNKSITATGAPFSLYECYGYNGDQSGAPLVS